MGKKSKTKTKVPKSSCPVTVIKPLLGELFQKCVSLPANVNGSELWNNFKEVWELTENIIKQQGQGLVSKLGPREQYLDDFKVWLKEHNIEDNLVELKSVSPELGLGLTAKTDLEAARAFLNIPRQAMITSESIMESELGPLIAGDPMLSTMPNVALAFFLVYQLCKEDSKWKPYVNALPRTYNNVLYFQLDDLELLKGTSVFQDILTICKSISRQYAYIHNLLIQNPLGKQLGIVDKLTFSDYRWAVSTMMTRQNPIPSEDGSRPILALVPMLDMCNHAEKPISIDYNPETRCCECFTPWPVKMGEEITIFYGSRPTSELVLYNGFFIDENPHDYLSLKLGISKGDPLYDIRNALLVRLGGSGSFPLYCTPNPVREPLRAFLQTFCGTEEEIRSLLSLRDEELVEALKQESLISKETKKKCLDFLKNRCTLLLKVSPSTNEKDDDLCRSKTLSEAGKLAILLRKNERRLLNDAVSYLSKELEQFQNVKNGHTKD